MGLAEAAVRTLETSEGAHAPRPGGRMSARSGIERVDWGPSVSRRVAGRCPDSESRQLTPVEAPGLIAPRTSLRLPKGREHVTRRLREEVKRSFVRQDQVVCSEHHLSL